MSTKYFYFTGKTKWPKIRPEYPDDYEGQKAWKVPLYLDKNSLKALKEIGLRLRPKTDDDGSYVTFKRDVVKAIGDKMVTFDPPVVMDKDNAAFDPKKIGNGSVLTVKVSVFDTRMGKGHRLESVRVEELVEYVPQAKEGASNAPAIGLPF